jgi:23S rRNA pseudouridine2605 synthase
MITVAHQRLSKVIAAAGIASRRAAEKLIFDGEVTVNGKAVLVPQTLVDPQVDAIAVEGKRLSAQPRKVYYVLHKPVGYHCTNASIVKRRAVDLVKPAAAMRLFTVGRLDKDTSGLILVTNDGHFANRVMHPSGGVKKEYIAKVNQEITHEHLVALSRGCVVEGALVKPVRVTKIRRGTLRIVVKEGRRHEVREILAAAGLEVIELKRVKIGDIILGTLAEGQFRELSSQEVQRLFPVQDSSEVSSIRPDLTPHPRSHSTKRSVG